MSAKQVTLRLVSVLGTALLSILLIPTLAGAQLDPVSWDESLQLDAAPGPEDNRAGPNTSAPDPMSGSVSGTGYSINGSISFASPGAPNVTATISSSYQNADLIALNGLVWSTISYQFAVRETSPPPVSVSTVPVNIRVQGTVDADGDPELTAQASSGANFWSLSSGTLDVWQISVNNLEGPASDSFDHNVQYLLAPDDVVNGGLQASANSYPEVLQNNTSSSATGWADPVIEVADETIPGSSASYRDHYEIEFASGY